MSAAAATPAADPPAAARGSLLAALGLATAEGFSGLGVSLLVHGVVLLVAAVWAVDAAVGVPGLTLSATPGDDSEELRLDVIDTAVELSGTAAPTLQAPPVELDPVDPDLLARAVAAAPADLAAGTAEGTGEGDGKGSEEGTSGVNVPGGGNVVKAGSFTVWSIPPDPRPRQNYLIVIQVDLPPELRLSKYPKRDLYGTVKGTDGYKQQLPSNDSRQRRGFLPIRNNTVQIVVPVPGAKQKLVKDRIVVGSRLLSEKQELELVF